MSTARAAAPALRQKLSENRCIEYQQLAMSRVHDTVDQYTALLESGDRRLSSKSWRLIKRHEGLKIFRARGRARFESGDQLSQSQWTSSVNVLCIGTLTGTVDDIMYGSVAPTAASMAARSVLINDGLTAHRVLQDIMQPTAKEPFQYCGLKWAKRSSQRTSLVKSRDFVYVEASGFLNAPLKGSVERVGYVVYHSVDVPELASDSSKRVVRGRMSICWIFRQRTAHSVEAFALLMTNPGGHVPLKLATMSAVNTLITSSSAMACALNKKLAWMMNNQEHDDLVSMPPVAVAKVRQGMWGCLHCGRGISSLSSLSSCGICQSAACTKCITTRELALKNSTGTIYPSSVKVCLGCVSKAQHNVDSASVAAQEYVKGPSFAEMWHSSYEFTDTGSTTSPRLELSDLDSDESEYPLTLTELAPTLDVNSLYSESEAESDCESVEIDGTDESEDDVELVTPVPVRENDRERLLRQMTALRIQAEQTYKYTSKQLRQYQRSKPDHLTQ